MCADPLNKAGEEILPALTFAETVAQAIKRWMAGFFFKSDPKEWKDTLPYKKKESPSVSASAVKHSATVSQLRET